MTTSITIDFAGTRLAGELDDSPASRSLRAQLPLELSFVDFVSQEVKAELPTPLDTAGMTESAPRPGDIAWYTPNGVLVLAYEPNTTWPGLFVIGRIDGDIDVLRGTRGATRTTVALTD